MKKPCGVKAVRSLRHYDQQIHVAIWAEFASSGRTEQDDAHWIHGLYYPSHHRIESIRGFRRQGPLHRRIISQGEVESDTAQAPS